MIECVMDTFNGVEKNWNVDEKWNKSKCLLISRGIVKVFWSSQNGLFVFDQIFVYGTWMGVDYKSEKKI